MLFQQYRRGKPVSGAWLKVDLDKDNRIFSVENTTVPATLLDKMEQSATKAKLDAKAAVQRAVNHLAAQMPRKRTMTLRADATAELVLYPQAPPRRAGLEADHPAGVAPARLADVRRRPHRPDPAPGGHAEDGDRPRAGLRSLAGGQPQRCDPQGPLEDPRHGLSRGRSPRRGRQRLPGRALRQHEDDPQAPAHGESPVPLHAQAAGVQGSHGLFPHRPGAALHPDAGLRQRQQPVDLREHRRAARRQLVLQPGHQGAHLRHRRHRRRRGRRDHPARVRPLDPGQPGTGLRRLRRGRARWARASATISPPASSRR